MQPRDAIIHYDDIQIIYYFCNMREIPKFICKKKQNIIEFSFEDVTSYTNSFYVFGSEIIRMVFEKITSFGE